MEIKEEDYQKAVAVVRKSLSGSVSNIQRKLYWGYCRAASAVDRMQNEFIVSPISASGRREVYPEEMHELWKELQAVKQQATPEGFVLVDKKHTEDWYLDDHEGMWWDQDGIDNSLCDLDPGQVQAVEHKEYLITESNTLYAAKVWDDLNDQVGYWEFFKTKEEAEKVASYCKAKFKGESVEAQEQSHD